MADEERNYSCLVLLLLRVGNTKIRLFFKSQWDALWMFPVWTDTPHNGADLLTKFRPLPYEKARVQSGDTSTWDMSILVKALLKSAPPFVSDKGLVAALECLRDMRNEFCHSPTPKVKAAVFHKKWQDACNALTLFGATSDDFDGVIQDAKKPWEDLNLLIQQCAENDKEILDALKRVTSEIHELRKEQKNLSQEQKQVREEVKQMSSKPGGNTYNVQARNFAMGNIDAPCSIGNQYVFGGVENLTLPTPPREQIVEGTNASLPTFSIEQLVEGNDNASLPTSSREQLEIEGTNASLQSPANEQLQ